MYQSNAGSRRRTLINSKAVSWIVIAVMAAVCLFPVAAAAADPVPEKAVKISYQKDSTGFALARQSKTVAANLSEQYGYEDAYNGAKTTALDAIVAAHIAIFGSDKAVINSKLSVGASGFATNFMGDGAGNFYYYVNDKTINEAAGDTLIEKGDVIELYGIQDTVAWSDVYARFQIEGKNEDSVTVKPGATVNLTVNGITWAGEAVVSGAAIVPVTVKKDGTATFGTKKAVTNSEGKASVTFNESGTYILSAVSGDATPLSSPWLVVTVQSKDAKLKKITKSTGTLSPKFKASKVSYKLKLKANKKSVKITPVKNDAKAKIQIKVGSGKYKNAKNVKVTLKKGKSKTVTIKVIAETGISKTYKVKVTRAKK